MKVFGARPFLQGVEKSSEVPTFWHTALMHASVASRIFKKGRKKQRVENKTV